MLPSSRCRLRSTQQPPCCRAICRHHRSNKVNPADAPILTLALTSDTLPLPRVQDLADTASRRSSQVNGSAWLRLSGGQKPAVRIQVNPRALTQLGLSLDDIRTAVSNQNVNQAKGSFDGPLRASTIDANDQLKDASEYAKLVIAATRAVRRSAFATLPPWSMTPRTSACGRATFDRDGKRCSSLGS